MIKLFRFVCLILLTSYHSSGMSDTDMYCTIMEAENEKCHIESNTQSYLISAEGTLIRDKDNKTITFRLPKKHHIETVQYKPFENKIIFTFSVSDGDSGSILVSVFDEDNYLFEWQTELFAFNTSPVLIHNNAIYLGGIGVIAKLNLYDGSIIWRHTGLYEPETQAYNAFEMPVIKKEFVIFKEQKVSDTGYSGIREIHVLDKTGKIIKK